MFGDRRNGDGSRGDRKFVTFNFYFHKPQIMINDHRYGGGGGDQRFFFI